jgi:hypothetical protein
MMWATGRAHTGDQDGRLGGERRGREMETGLFKYTTRESGFKGKPEISGSHGGEFEDGCLLGYCAV